MSAIELMAECQRIGLTVETDGEWLVISPAEPVPPALQDRLRAHKAEIIAVLAANSSSPFDLLPDKLRVRQALIAWLEGWTWDLDVALDILGRLIRDEGVPAAELVEVLELHLATHHAEAWAERLAIEGELDDITIARLVTGQKEADR